MARLLLLLVVSSVSATQTWLYRLLMIRVRCLSALALFILPIVSASLAAQPSAGDLDPTFGNSGKILADIPFGGNDAELTAAVVQPDGRIVAAGFSFSGGTEFSVLRFNSDGTLDDSFDASGDFYPRGRAHAMALDPSNQKIVVGGYVVGDGVNAFALARYNPDGSYDPSFGAAGDGLVQLDIGLAHFIYDLVVRPDGKILIAGTVIGDASPLSDFALIRLNEDGALDETFGNGGHVLLDFFGGFDAAVEVTLLSDGSVLALGRADAPFGQPGSPRFVLARYDSGGMLDPAFGDGGQVILEVDQNFCAGFAVQADGKIVLAASQLAGDSLFRFEANGALDPSFGDGGRVDDFAGQFSGGTPCAHTVGIDIDGRILVLRSIEVDPGVSDFLLTRYAADGSLDTSFGTEGRITVDFAGGEELPSALVLPGDGTYLLAGTAFLPSGITTFAMSRHLRAAGAETPAGSGVQVQPIDGANDTQPVTIQFDQVIAGGMTHVRSTATGPTPPSGFSIGEPATYYELATTASYDGTIQVCFDYRNVSYIDESQLKLFHYEGGQWMDITALGYPDTTADIICGTTTSFSPFALFEPVPMNTVRTIRIDVKPASKKNVVRLAGKGKLRVALLSDPGFDARTIDISTVRLSGASVAVNKKGKPVTSVQDVNRDGRKDLIVSVRKAELSLPPGEGLTVLTAQTFDGLQVRGSDWITAIRRPASKEKEHDIDEMEDEE